MWNGKSARLSKIQGILFSKKNGKMLKFIIRYTILNKNTNAIAIKNINLFSRKMHIGNNMFKNDQVNL